MFDLSLLHCLCYGGRKDELIRISFKLVKFYGIGCGYGFGDLKMIGSKYES
jgi:hypothetical protein